MTALTGHTGTVKVTTSYDAFGNTSLALSGTGNDLLYTGREYDRSTGLYYYRARYYDPEIGRFVSEDPLGFAAGDVNFYAYVGNNPINNNDPSGKVSGIFGPLNMKGALSNPDFGRISNFSNAVGVTGTAIAAAPPLAGLIAGVAPVLGEVSALGSSAALTSGLIGGATGALGTLATESFNARDLAINTGVGFIAGTLVPIRPVTGFLANTGKGAAIGGAASFTSQSIDILTDRTKSFGQDFNTGAVIGSAIGGGFTAGLTSPFGNSLGEQISAGIFSFGPEVAASTIGERLGAPSASGGFVLYPSKPNTNMLQSVYRK